MYRILCVYMAIWCGIAGFGFGGENLLSPAEFTAENGWIVWMSEQMKTGGAKVELKEGKAIALIPAVDGQKFSSVQVVKPLGIEAGKTYRFHVRMVSDREGAVVVGYGMRGGAYTNYGVLKLQVAAGEKTYDGMLQVKAGADGSYETPRVLRIHLGGLASANVTISDIALEENPPKDNE